VSLRLAGRLADRGDLAFATTPGWIQAPIGSTCNPTIIGSRNMSTFGIILVVAGAALMVAEAHVPSTVCSVQVRRRRSVPGSSSPSRELARPAEPW
jgi:hypothetical protein